MISAYKFGFTDTGRELGLHDLSLQIWSPLTLAGSLACMILAQHKLGLY